MAVEIILTLQHKPVPGDVITKDIVTVEAQSFSWGADNPATIGSATAGAGAGKAKLAEASFTKLADDVASPLLFHLLATGERLETVTVTIRKAGSTAAGTPTPTEMANITLSLVFVTHFAQNVSGGDESLQDVVQVAYGSVAMTVNGTDPTGKGTPGTPASWNQVTNTTSVALPGEMV